MKMEQGSIEMYGL